MTQSSTVAKTPQAEVQDILGDDWEMVIGLEVHAELATETKMFSPAANKFGGEPNTNVHPVCLGLPGTLPVVNRKAVELSISIGLALNCHIQDCVFARKNYFYPDMPKDYQISQYDRPLNGEGFLDLPSGKRVQIERAHMEEDTGKSTHVGDSGRIHDAGYSLVDYNRAGVPLIEIVSKPDIESPEQAKEYVDELRSILIALKASDGKMEEGSLRVDANVSVRPKGSTELRTRCEVKNVNSLRSVGRAITFEAKRQVRLYENGEAPIQQTRHWDEEAGRTVDGRSKEEAEDYRYFADPDLVPINDLEQWIDEISAAMPILPSQQRSELVSLGLNPEDAAGVINRGFATLAKDSIERGAVPERVATHLINNLTADEPGKLSAAALAELVTLEASGKLTATQTKQVLADMVETGKAAAEIAAAKGFEAMDSSDLEAIVDEIIANNPQEWERYASGDDKTKQKMQGFFTGQIMKATKGKADGKLVNQLLTSKAQ